MDRMADLSYDIQLPRAGTVAVVSVTTAAVIDLSGGAPAAASSNFTANTQGGGQASQAASAGGVGPVQIQPPGYIAHYIDICTDGGDLGIISGPTAASVSGANAPVLATTGGAGTAGVCQRQFGNTIRPYYVKPDDRFLGVVSASTTIVRISLSSR
jgi:hypothetical protein